MGQVAPIVLAREGGRPSRRVLERRHSSALRSPQRKDRSGERRREAGGRQSDDHAGSRSPASGVARNTPRAMARAMVAPAAA